MKLTNDYKKLFVIISLLIGSLLAFYFMANLTLLERNPVLANRDITLAEELDSDPYINQMTNIEERLTKVEGMLDYITSSITTISTYYETYLETVKEEVKESLTVETLYVNYAYEISMFSYPNIDPAYVCAIIFHESRFDPNALNESTDARGLTQIRPKWHSERAKRLGVTDLYDPHGNILVCFDLLNEQTEKYNFEYALNLFAGGYPYANRYRNSTSPFIRELNEIMEEQNFSECVLSCYLPGGETSAAS